MRRRVHSLALSIVWAITACTSSKPLVEEGIWSSEARVLRYDQGSRHIRVASPDSSTTVIVDDASLRVIANGAQLRGAEDLGVTSLCEIGWAPNSAAFFLTESYGGAVGEWRTRVYVIEGDSVRSVNITNEVESDFRKDYECIERQDPNVGAGGWMDDSERLLVVAEVPPHSNCPEMGRRAGYFVEVPSGRIIEKLDESTLLSKWRLDLGQRFRHE